MEFIQRQVMRCAYCENAIRSNEKILKIGNKYFCSKHIKYGKIQSEKKR